MYLSIPAPFFFFLENHMTIPMTLACSCTDFLLNIHLYFTDRKLPEGTGNTAQLWSACLACEVQLQTKQTTCWRHAGNTDRSSKDKLSNQSNETPAFLGIGSLFSCLLSWPGKRMSLYWASDCPPPLACVHISSIRRYEPSSFPPPWLSCRKQNGNTCFLLTHTQTLQNKKYELSPSSCVCALNMCKHWTECRYSKAVLEKVSSFPSLHPLPYI